MEFKVKCPKCNELDIIQIYEGGYRCEKCKKFFVIVYNDWVDDKRTEEDKSTFKKWIGGKNGKT